MNKTCDLFNSALKKICDARPNLYMKSTSVNLKKYNAIVFTHGGGRFGNQMFSFAQILAFAFEYENIAIINMSFWEYSSLLELGNQNYICAKSPDPNRYKSWKYLCKFCELLHIKNGSLAKRLIIFILYFYGNSIFSKSHQSIIKNPNDFLFGQKNKAFDLANPTSFDLINNAEITFCSGWNICDWKLVEKHKHEIQDFLKIRQDYVNTSRIFISDKRGKYDFLIGIMIRQGDYQFWENGRYYFPTQQYLKWLDQLNEIFADRGKIGFIIASDTIQDSHDFKNKNSHFTTGIAGNSGHYLESLIQLSLCDVIASPPSTFSMWAAFIGDTSMIPLLNVDQILGEEQLLSNNLFDFVDIEC
jgi:Glycosyl transferase family 11